MKIISFLILQSWLMLLTSPVSAGIIFIPIGGVYDDLGATTVQNQFFGRRLQVSTRDLGGSWTVACDGDADCLATGLDAMALDVGQNLDLTINLFTGRVRGTSRGRIHDLPPAATDFQTRIQGDAACIGSQPDPCQLVAVDLELKGFLFTEGGNTARGKLALSLLGTLSIGDGGAVPSGWTALDGNGVLGLRQ